MSVELNRAALAPDATREIVLNLAELDDLVQKILLSRRRDHDAADDRREPVDLLALAAEEAARVGAEATGAPVVVDGDPRLLRRLLLNLLENARKHGAPPILVALGRTDRTSRPSQCAITAPASPTAIASSNPFTARRAGARHSEAGASA